MTIPCHLSRFYLFSMLGHDMDFGQVQVMVFSWHLLRKMMGFPVRIWFNFRPNCRQKDMRQSLSYFLQGHIQCTHFYNMHMVLSPCKYGVKAQQGPMTISSPSLPLSCPFLRMYKAYVQNKYRTGQNKTPLFSIHYRWEIWSRWSLHLTHRESIR